MIKQFSIPIFLLIVLAVITAKAVNADSQVEGQGFAVLDTIETDDLAGLSGRDNLTNVQSIQELDASVSSSSFNVDTMVTGAITIEQYAMDHFKGLGLFNILTGNNNAVDSAVGISIYLSE